MNMNSFNFGRRSGGHGIVSCQETDTEAPTACTGLGATNSVTAEEIEAEAGDHIDLEDIFCDNEALSEVRWDIHNGEGHATKTRRMAKRRSTSTAWCCTAAQIGLCLKPKRCQELRRKWICTWTCPSPRAGCGT